MMQLYRMLDKTKYKSEIERQIEKDISKSRGNLPNHREKNMNIKWGEGIIFVGLFCNRLMMRLQLKVELS